MYIAQYKQILSSLMYAFGRFNRVDINNLNIMFFASVHVSKCLLLSGEQDF